MHITAPQYWRQSKSWHKLLGKTGSIIAATIIRVAPPECDGLAPYSFLIIRVGRVNLEFMGTGSDQFEIGEKVQLVLRKLAQPDSAGIIHYGIKAQKLHL